MKYKCFKKNKKDDFRGGDYWRDFDFQEHLKLTDYQTTFQFITREFKPPQNILEAGCGLGRWVVPLAKMNYKVTGIDIEEEALDVIKKNYSSENLELIHGDIFQMPFPEKHFDLIISLGVLEHFESKNNVNEAIKEHIRVLSDSGFILITVPYMSVMRLMIHVPYKNALSLVRKLKGKKEYFTEYRYSVKAFKKLIQNNGLRVKRIIYDELDEPYNFGLTVDFPLKKWFRDGDNPFLLNQRGRRINRFLWKVNPRLVSGGIGFLCKKDIPSSL